MKRKLAVLLALALSAAMLGGCGGSSKTGSSTSGSSKRKTLSEYLSKEDTICYMVSSMDKDVTPANIYFFKDGTLTVLSGGAFGLTMGDFAQMTDKEIWKIYEDVRESYAEEYVAERLAEVQSRLEKEENSLEDYSSVMNWFQGAKEEVLNEINKGSIDEEDAAYELTLQFYEYIFGGTEAESMPTEIEEVENLLIVSVNELLTETENIIAELEQLNTESACAGPFYDRPFYFNVITDSSGNNVQDEQIVWATDEYSMFDAIYDNIEDEYGNLPDIHIPTTYYTYITFANAEGADREIYDSTYNCFALRSSDYTFCTRDSMTLDTVDSKNILLDQSKDELNALFEAEVMARYE